MFFLLFYGSKVEIQSEVKIKIANGYLEFSTSSFCKSVSASFLLSLQPMKAGIVHNMFVDNFFTF